MKVGAMHVVQCRQIEDAFVLYQVVRGLTYRLIDNGLSDLRHIEWTVGKLVWEGGLVPSEDITDAYLINAQSLLFPDERNDA